MDKPIGLLLQREEYEKRDGGVGYKFNIALPFEPSSGMSAGEILTRATSATSVDKALAALRDKTMKPRTQPSSGYTRTPGSGGSGVGDMDDDIPFADPFKGRRSYVV
jgi:hypothetical protein